MFLINISKTIFFLLLIFCATQSYSQVDSLKSPTMKIVLKDGSVLIGRIESKENKTINFITSAQIKVQIPQSEIEEIIRMEEINSPVPPIDEDSLKSADRNLSRMLFLPTARAMGKFRGSFHSNLLQFPVFNFGLGDFLTAGIGTHLLSFGYNPAYILNAKITPYENDWLAVAGGIIYFGSSEGFYQRSDLSFAHLLATLSYKDNDFTIGLVKGSGMDNDKKMFLAIGFTIKLTDGHKIISENWIRPNSEFSMRSIAVRFYGEKLSADVGIFINTAERFHTPTYPWLSFTYNFSLK